MNRRGLLPQPQKVIKEQNNIFITSCYFSHDISHQFGWIFANFSQVVASFVPKYKCNLYGTGLCNGCKTPITAPHSKFCTLKGGKVCTPAKHSTRPELYPASFAWSKQQYCYPPPGWNVSPSWAFSLWAGGGEGGEEGRGGRGAYSSVERGTLRAKLPRTSL